MEEKVVVILSDNDVTEIKKGNTIEKEICNLTVTIKAK